MHNCQRYGPPPSYPQLKIPGLNAPIPPGASFGYRPGEWGKPPVDEVYRLLKLFYYRYPDVLTVPFLSSFIISCQQHGRPLYGDVFGVLQQDEPTYDVCSSSHFSVKYF